MLPVFDGLRNITLASVAFRLILSTLCGGIVGMEREFKRRSAGFRTHINPYCFRCGDTPVRVRFVAEERTLKESLRSYFSSLK